MSRHAGIGPQFIPSAERDLYSLSSNISGDAGYQCNLDNTVTTTTIRHLEGCALSADPERPCGFSEPRVLTKMILLAASC